MTINSFIAALIDVSVIQVSGEQRQDYLHGQLTVATKAFDANYARIAAHCDFKGKMFAAVTLSDFQDSFLLSMHKDSALESQAQLKKYGVFSKVEISMSEQLRPMGIFGDDCIDYLKALFPELTTTHMAAANSEFGQAICFNDANLRYLCYLNDEGVNTLLSLSGDASLAQPSLWNILEVEAGLANVQGATIGQFVPQMLNLQSLNAIDFNKGCYMGQEVVARTKFLGKNKRATFLLTGIYPKATITETLRPGEALEMQIGNDWRRAGIIVRYAHYEGPQFDESDTITVTLLAVLPNDTLDDAVLRLKDSNIALSITALPYAVNN